MELPGINHQLGGHVQAFEGLVHLLGVEQGHVEVLFAAHEQGGGFDAVGVKEGVRHAHVHVGVFPGRAQLGFVVADVLVGAVAGQHVGNAGTAHGGLEALVAGNNLVGQDAPVAPAAHAQPLGVGHALRHGVVYHGQHVVGVLVAPIGINGLAVGQAPARAAARIGRHHGKTVGGEVLPLKRKPVVKLGHRPAVNAQQRGVLAPGLVAHGLHHEAAHQRAVFAFGLDGLHRAQGNTAEPGIVLLG